MFNLFRKPKHVEVKIMKCSKSIVLFPCRLTINKNGVDSKTYEILGYINEGNMRKFMFVERGHRLGVLHINAITIPMDVAERLINNGHLKTEEFEYEFKKLK